MFSSIEKSLRISLSLTLILAGELWCAEPLSVLLSESVTVERENPQVFSFEAPPGLPDQVLALEFEARGERSSHPPPQIAYLLEIRLNGKEVRGADNRLQPRLRNKSLTEHGQAWHRSHVGWQVVYAGKFPETPNERNHTAEKFHTAVEIESLIQEGTNRLEFSQIRQSSPDDKIHLQNIRLVRLPRIEPPPQFRFSDEPAVTIQTNPQNDIALQQAGLDHGLTASLGNPGGGWLERGSHVPWLKRKVIPAREVRGNGSLQSDQIRWDRHLDQSSPDHLEIEEVITNLTDREVGTMFRIDLPFSSPIENGWLAGDGDPGSLQVKEAANPTVFVPCGKWSLGLVAEDDLFRSQAVFSCQPDASGVSMRAERLFLGPRGTLKLRWSLYLLREAQYFDFINRLRSDWGVRMRIPGSLWWNALTRNEKNDQELSRWLKANHPFAAVIGSWVDHTKHERPETVGLGTGVMESAFAGYRQRVRLFRDRLKSLDPDLNVVIYNHCFFNWPESDPEKYRDSWIVKEDGRRYVEPASRNESEAPGVYPTLENSFGESFENVLVQQRRELGVDGFYLDETTSPGRLRDPVTYGESDGMTAILDPKTLVIQKKAGALSLLSAPWLSRLSQRLLDARLVVLGNYAPVTRDQNRMQWPRFVETDNLGNCPAAHLYAPLAFSYRFEHYTMQDIRDRLDQGLVWCVTGPEDRIGIVRHFFPLTPTALHSGWVQGEERIITARSGRYGWEERSLVRLWLYNSAGELQETDPAWGMADQPVRIDVPEGGVAILERQSPNPPVK